MIRGVDVSSWQPEEFTMALDGQPVDFAIIKVTEGEEYVNPKWEAQRDWARLNGLSVGYYHFVRPGSVVTQADRFLETAQPDPGEHLWLDWEDAGVSSDQKDDFIRYLKEKAPRHRVGLYCNRNFWLNRDTSSYAGDALWIASHSVAPGTPGIEYDWLIHQYSADGGIDHNAADFPNRATMQAWALLPAREVPDETDSVMEALNMIAQGVANVIHAQHRLEDELRAEREVSRARYDALKAELTEIRGIMELEPAAGDVARAVADELARRLQS